MDDIVGSTWPSQPRRAALAAALLFLAACGGGEAAAPTEDAASPATGEIAVADDETTETTDGRGGAGEPDEAVPAYDTSNERTEDYEGTPEPCLLLTPALVASIHGPFDKQLLLSGPVCSYISAEPLFDVSLFVGPPATCDQILDGWQELGREIEAETFDGAIVSWLIGDNAVNALLYDQGWCFQIKVLSTGADRATVTRYVDAIADALG